MTGSQIVAVDVDDSNYVGDEDDGVYWSVGEGTDGWYVSTMVDCNTSSFTADYQIDDGPYASEKEAMEAGRCAGLEWCMENGVNTDDEGDE